VTPAHTFFGRAEIAGTRGHDLHVHEAERGIFTVGKIQGGYVRLFAPLGGVQAGLGGSVSASFVPATLQPRYGGVAMGVGVFATLRPTVAIR
jgi:hypothetical protein